MPNVKKLKRKIARAVRSTAKPVHVPHTPKPRRSVASLSREIANATANTAAARLIDDIKAKRNGNGPKKRRGPTSVRFTAEDMQLLNKLKERWKTDGPTTTLRKAMQLAESAVVCTFITEG